MGILAQQVAKRLVGDARHLSCYDVDLSCGTPVLSFNLGGKSCGFAHSIFGNENLPRFASFSDRCHPAIYPVILL